MKTIDTIPLGQMNASELQTRLAFFGRRAKQLNGVMRVNGAIVPMGAAVEKFMGEIGGTLTDPEKIRQRDEFMAKVESDPETKRQFCAMRLEQYDNFLYAQLDWISQYGQIVTLGDADRPMEQNTTGLELPCFYVGEDGTPTKMSINKDVAERELPLRRITTPNVRYKVWDLYRGSVVDAALKAINLTRDLKNMMENEFLTMIKANAFGAFTFPGGTKKVNYPFVVSKYVNPANLPPTNDIVVANSPGYFDWSTLDDILDYCNRWSNLSGEDLRPTGLVRVASKNIRQFSKGVTPNGALASPIAESQLEQGWTGVNYRGVAWKFKPDPTLNPADMQAWPEFNLKPARVFFKPSGDREVVRTGQQFSELFDRNEEERQMSKVYSASINQATRKNIARFTFGSVTAYNAGSLTQ